MNGDPLGDSPYPLFFSAPVPQPEAAAGVDPQLPAVPGALQPGAAAAMPGMSMPMPALGAGGLPIVTAESIKAAQQQAAAGGAGGAAMTAAFPNLATGVQISLVGHADPGSTHRGAALQEQLAAGPAPRGGGPAAWLAGRRRLHAVAPCLHAPCRAACSWCQQPRRCVSPP